MQTTTKILLCKQHADGIKDNSNPTMHSTSQHSQSYEVKANMKCQSHHPSKIKYVLILTPIKAGIDTIYSPKAKIFVQTNYKMLLKVRFKHIQSKFTIAHT